MLPQELSDWLHALAHEVDATNPNYPRNLVDGPPVPFFGNILKARVLTIGVNPSSTEFIKKRHWPSPSELPDWQHRMENYFNLPQYAPHPWFDTWSIGLELLHLSYASGQAAHLDISPRPTKAMINNHRTDPVEFRAMAEHDKQWFFQLLQRLDQVRLLLVAGPIPHTNGRPQQLADFIREHTKRSCLEWVSGEPMPVLRSAAGVPGIPVFICPYEHGVDGKYAMIRHVYRHRDLLRRLASG